MVVAMDVGDPVKIHPPLKQPVGERLALAARAVALGEPVIHSGPLVSRVQAGPGPVVAVEFDHLGSGLAIQGPTLHGFELAGSSGVFHGATALVVGDRVLLQSAAVAKPARARYGWAGYPVPPINLTNVEGLLASPFESRVEGPGEAPGSLRP
jgi:sialate O-acetylesterase